MTDTGVYARFVRLAAGAGSAGKERGGGGVKVCFCVPRLWGRGEEMGGDDGEMMGNDTDGFVGVYASEGAIIA